MPYHALYYPNPWPKQSEAGRRFHLHPIFPTLLRLAQKTELRTNWEIYAQEFAQAVRLLLPNASVTVQPIKEGEPITAFERKYKNARQQLWWSIIHQ
jgi:tRNA G46 methylase TrmB